MDLRFDRQSISIVASRKLILSQFRSVLKACCHKVVRIKIILLKGASHAHWNFILSFRSSVLGE